MRFRHVCVYFVLFEVCRVQRADSERNDWLQSDCRACRMSAEYLHSAEWHAEWLQSRSAATLIYVGHSASVNAPGHACFQHLHLHASSTDSILQGRLQTTYNLLGHK
ncbi:hypothetical protein COO60DRAFT_487669 [Scenedesmus sp. NREL 46B-D3]|nr:hypothetical protein COO60DRAFT_487669 [Scenedesmus sp. NREL 46B-D3]